MPTLRLVPNPHNILCIELNINKEKHLFVVDTGATYSYIRESLVKHENVKVTKVIRVDENFLAHRTEQVFNFCGVSLSHVMIDSNLHKHTDYSGLIGQDILRQFSRVVVDYVRSTITFEK